MKKRIPKVVAPPLPRPLKFPRPLPLPRPDAN